MGIIYIITGQLDICLSDSGPRVVLERCVLDGDLLDCGWGVVTVVVSWWSIVILNHVSPGRCSQSGQLASVLRQSGKLFFVPLNAAPPIQPKGGGEGGGCATLATTTNTLYAHSQTIHIPRIRAARFTYESCTSNRF